MRPVAKKEAMNLTSAIAYLRPRLVCRTVFVALPLLQIPTIARGAEVGVRTADGVSAATPTHGAWSPIGPDGGSVIALAADPQDFGTAYAGTLGGGLFRTGDGGESWSRPGGGFAADNVYALTVGPAGVVYAGTEKGIFRSLDRGVSWQSASAGLPLVAGGTRVVALAADPSLSGRVYATVFQNGTTTRVFQTADGGGSWRQSGHGIPWPAQAGPLATAQRSGVVYAGTVKEGVYKSDDGGARWRKASNGLTLKNVQAIAVDPFAPETIYAGSAQYPYAPSFFVSSDGGASWQPRMAGFPQFPVRISSLVASGATRGTLYAGTINAGVFRSEDGGLTWIAANDGLPCCSAEYGSSPPPVNALVADSNASSGRLYVGVASFAGAGVWKTGSSGRHWRSASRGIQASSIAALAVAVGRGCPDCPPRLALCAGTWFQGLFRSLDAGGTWLPSNDGLTTSEINALAVDSIDPRTAYVGTTEGVFRSNDGGQSWNPTPSWPDQGPSDTFAIASDPTAAGRVYAGDSGGIFRSDDSGATWQAAVGFDQTLILGLAVAPSSPVQLYATGLAPANTPAIFLTSEDGGLIFTDRLELRDGAFAALTVEPLNSAVVYASFGGALRKSLDGGTTWSPTAFEGAPSALLIDPAHPTTLYAAAGLRVSLSHDGGSTWELLGGSLGAPAVQLAVIHANPDVLLAATAGNGVVRLSLKPANRTAPAERGHLSRPR
jgi:photosystem II stability/assembly factor-like uncharacterized protein